MGPLRSKLTDLYYSRASFEKESLVQWLIAVIETHKFGPMVWETHHQIWMIYFQIYIHKFG
jgi:hypothetical protein